MAAIRDVLTENSTSYVALSVFMIITITLGIDQHPLSQLLALLSAGMSYLLMLETISGSDDKDTLTLMLFTSFNLFFVLTFCVWVILNLILPLNSSTDWLMILLWIVFMLYAPYKLLGRRSKIIFILCSMLIILISIVYPWII